MKLKADNGGGGEANGKIKGNLTSWCLTFGKHQGKSSDDIDHGYLSWMLSEMDLSKNETELLQAILRGDKPPEGQQAPEAPKKAQKAPKSKLNQFENIAIYELQDEIDTLREMMLEMRELIYVHNEAIWPTPECREQRKINAALDKFEAELTKKPKKKAAKKKTTKKKK